MTDFAGWPRLLATWGLMEAFQTATFGRVTVHVLRPVPGATGFVQQWLRPCVRLATSRKAAPVESVDASRSGESASPAGGFDCQRNNDVASHRGPSLSRQPFSGQK